jgi:uncharacterized membrane protein YozB (DUF420 family)
MARKGRTLEARSEGAIRTPGDYSGPLALSITRARPQAGKLAVPMDPKLLYWTAALVNLGAVVACALVGWRRARRRELQAHRRSMLAGAWLVLGFLVSYVLKVLWLGREQLELWDPAYVRVLHVHELFVLLLLLCGSGALVQARRLGLPRGPDSRPIGARELARGLRAHRWLGRIGIASSIFGLLTAAYVLWGMYERAGGGV